MKAYFERQIISPWFLAPLVTAIMWFTFAYLYQIGDNPFTLTLYCLTILILTLSLLFCVKMDTHIDDTHIKVVFGMGFFSKKISLDDICSVNCVKLGWYHGIGIKMRLHKTLFRIKFNDVVELRFKGRIRFIQIGSKDVERLKQAIEARL